MRPQKRAPAGRAPAGRPAPAQLRFAPVTHEEIAGYVDLLAGSYPLFVTDRERTADGLREVLNFGYPELIAGTGADGRMAGVYAFYPFVATLRGRGLPAAGLGMVATALDRRRERVALEIVRDFVRRARKRGMPLTLLYPFRHSFYADMGWGPVAEERQYAVPPSALPLFPERKHVQWVRDPRWEALDVIHRRSVGAQGGLGVSRHLVRWHGLLRQVRHVFLYGGSEKPDGYLMGNFVKRAGDTDQFHEDFEVIEMDWTTPEAMRGLLGLLSSFRDQVTEVILNWPRERPLEPILREPVRRTVPILPGHLGHGPTVAHGVMLRLEDPEEAFRTRSYAGSAALALEVATDDPLRDGRAVRFRSVLRGEDSSGVRPRMARVSCGLSVLSQLWAGALRFRHAVEFGIAEVTPERAVDTLDELFAVPPPRVVERF